MPDSKITALTALTAADPANDMIPIVDVSDTPPASGNTKRISINNLLACSPSATLASATITGDLTVDTSTLKVDSANNRVGIGTASPTSDLDIFRASGSGITSGISLRTAAGAGGDGSFIKWLAGGTNEKVAQIDGVLNGTDVGYLSFQCGNGADAMAEQYRVASSGLFTWYDGAGGTRMTLNSTGLGVGQPPTAKLDILGDPSSAANNTTTGALTKMRDIYTRFRANSAGISGDVYAAQLFQGAGSAFEIYNATSNPLVFGTAATERMRIDSSGNVGIGVTPSAWATYKAVSVGGIGASVFGLGSSQAGVAQGAFFNNGAGSGWAYSATSQVPTYYLQINGENIWNIAASGTAGAQITAWTPAMKLDASGNLLVGKSSAVATAVGIQFQPAGNSYHTLAASTNADTTLLVYSTGAAAYRFYVGMAGTVFATNTTISAISDARLKENVQDLDVGLDAILALKPRKFDWKEGKGKNIKGDRGFIAQEFETVFPNLIDEWKDEAPEGEAPYKSVRQDLIPVLVKAIQELTARVQTLEAK